MVRKEIIKIKISSDDSDRPFKIQWIREKEKKQGRGKGRVEKKDDEDEGEWQRGNGDGTGVKRVLDIRHKK